jgi:hypothetical protein
VNTKWRQLLLKFWRARFFSPLGFLGRALVITAVFLAIHLARLRDYTSVLNGTVGPAAASWKTSAFFGIAYLVMYMAFVLLVPVLILAAAILELCGRLKGKNEPTLNSSPGKGQ